MRGFPPITRHHAAQRLAYLALCMLTAGSIARASAAPHNNPVISIDGKDCTTAECHGALRQTKFVHGPVTQGDCQPCHQSRGAVDAQDRPLEHDFKTAAADLAHCGQCHQEMSHARASVHEPFRAACTTCHDPHGGRHRHFLTADKVGEGCLNCHETLLKDRPYLHAPVALNACDSCHDPHAADQPYLLKRPPEQLCVYCHANFQSGMNKAVSVHAPMRGACTDCHDPHGGRARSFLLAESQEALCARCHGKLLEARAQTVYPHAQMVEGRQCAQCHDPHWSASSKLLRRPSMEICLECHREPLATPSGRTVAGVGHQIESSSSLHGPLRQQDCTPCHSAHGSDDPRLLKADFPEGFYANYKDGAYALCIGCHDSALIGQERTLATGFRNGDQNLHYLHVRMEKGRSCRACHAEHASDSPFHIREQLPFGKWPLELKFVPNDEGGSCLAGCHRPRAYNREHPIAPADWPEGESP